MAQKIKLLKKIHKLGPDIVAITEGKKGVYVLDNDYFYNGKPTNVKIVETTKMRCKCFEIN